MSNILIVGANQGIGYYMAIRLLEKGNKVTVLDIQDNHISELKENYQDSLLIIRSDATDEESLSEGIKKSIKEFGNVDIAIHNACLCTFANEQDTGYEVYQKVMDVNYFGALRLSKLILPFMREKKEGRIIFTGSGVGVTGFGNISPMHLQKVQ